MGKEVTLRSLFCLESFQMMANGERKFLLFFPSVNYRRIFSIHLKNSHFVEDVLFYPENGVMAFPKIEIKWDWVSDLHFYVKSDAVIWFWRCCHVRTRQTSENQTTDRTCVVQTNSRVKWSWFNSEMSEFNCLARTFVLSMLLFHTFYPIRPNFRKWFCLTKHRATFSSLNILRRYDEHACDTTFFSLGWKLKN